MSFGKVFISLYAFATNARPAERLEQRIARFLESDSGTESLDDDAFSKANGSGTKADYFLSGRRIIAELKTLNGDPLDRTEQRLRKRFQEADAPTVFGTVGLSKVIEGLSDQQDLNKMLVDIAGRAVRRHLQKANDQIAGIKARFNLANASGLVILMNDTEPMIDAGAITYATISAFQNVEGGYPHITDVWATVESHKIRMTDGRTGYPQLHLFKSQERAAELDFMVRMLGGWAHANGARLEGIQQNGGWDVMRPVYEGGIPTVRPWPE